MSRKIVLAWELGSNLGHLARLLPLAAGLKAGGLSPLLISRELGLAAKVFAEVAIPFIQAPAANPFPTPARPAVSYAEILWNQGWADRAQLWGLVQGWANLLRMFRPELIVVDHSPTALLAARVTGIPVMLIGAGFEIPPDACPIPGFATAEPSAPGILDAERRVLENANWLLEASKVRPLSALCDLFRVDRRYLTTFPELDHYGARVNENYVGPIGELRGGTSVNWPANPGRRIFAYLRPGNTDNRAIFRALRSTGAAVVCVLPGAPADLVEEFRSDRISIATRPVQLAGLIDGADLFVSYAPSGTVAATLAKGIPQLMSPQHPEARLTALRVCELGAGLTMNERRSEEEIQALIERLLGEPIFRVSAGEFARAHADHDAARAADLMVEEIIHGGFRGQKPVAPCPSDATV
jgi:UDP:flavonoid glycosyltransferase YjiC (YdhE family)